MGFRVWGLGFIGFRVPRVYGFGFFLGVSKVRNMGPLGILGTLKGAYRVYSRFLRARGPWFQSWTV